VVEEEKKKKEKYQEMYDKVVERLNGLKIRINGKA